MLVFSDKPGDLSLSPLLVRKQHSRNAIALKLQPLRSMTKNEDVSNFLLTTLWAKAIVNVRHEAVQYQNIASTHSITCNNE